MNLNFHHKPDYALHTDLIDELISLYGTPVRFLVMEKIVDSITADNSHENASDALQIFGDFKTLKTDMFRDALEFNVLLSDNEEFPNGLQFAFNNFGMINDDTLTVFVSLKSLETLANERGEVHPKEIISNLLLFPNGKLMEITNCQLHVPGRNNQFVYSSSPSCYELSLKSYSFDFGAVDKIKKNDVRVQVHESKGPQTLQTLDDFFDKRLTQAQAISNEANIEVQVPDPINPLALVGKQAKIDDVFGSMG